MHKLSFLGKLLTVGLLGGLGYGGYRHYVKERRAGDPMYHAELNFEEALNRDRKALAERPLPVSKLPPSAFESIRARKLV